MSVLTLMGLWAPSTRIRGLSLTSSMRPGTRTLARPAVTFSSGQLKPAPLSTSTAAIASAQLRAWCSPGRGTGRCSSRVVFV